MYRQIVIYVTFLYGSLVNFISSDATTNQLNDCNVYSIFAKKPCLKYYILSQRTFHENVVLYIIMLSHKMQMPYLDCTAGSD